MTCEIADIQVPNEKFVGYKVIRNNRQPFFMGYTHKRKNLPPSAKRYVPHLNYHAVTKDGKRITTINPSHGRVFEGIHVFLHREDAMNVMGRSHGRHYRTMLIEVVCDPQHLIGAGHFTAYPPKKLEVAVFTQVRVKSGFISFIQQQLECWWKGRKHEEF